MVEKCEENRVGFSNTMFFFVLHVFTFFFLSFCSPFCYSKSLVGGE